MRFRQRAALAVIVLLLWVAPCLADYVSEVTADSPMAWWRFEDVSSVSGSTAADTAGSYDGTYMGDIEFAGGVSGQAALFDGTLDYVFVGSMGSLPAQGSIEMWLLPEAVESYRNPMTTGPLGGSIDGNHAIRFESYTGGSLKVAIGDDTGASADFTATLTSGLESRRWVHLVLTWDTALGVVNAFLDGDQVLTDVANTYWPSQLAEVHIGIGWGMFADRSWDGRIDEVAIYDTALTSERVAAHHAAGMPPLAAAVHEDRPWAWWRFEELSSATSDPAFDFLGTFDGVYDGDIIHVTGIAGQAADFDGDLDLVDIGNIGPLPPEGSFELWIRPAVVESYRSPMTTAPLGGSSTGNRGFRFEEYTGGTLNLAIGDDTATTSPQFITTITTSLAADEWSHIVVNWDTVGNLLNAYFNGALVVVDAANTNWPSSLGNVNLGIGWGAYSDRSFLGLIDEVAFYDVPLTAERVQAHYEAPFAIFADGFESGDTSGWSSAAP